MTAKQITYSATYDNNGTEITKTRTSHRPYTHAAVYDYGHGDGPFIGSFHATAAAAAKGSVSGIKPIAVVDATPITGTQTPAADTTPAQTTPDTPTQVGPAAISERIDAAHAAADAKKTTPKKATKKTTPKAAPKAQTPTNADIETAAAELAAESTPNADTAESTPTNGHAVVEFFNHLLDTGAMNAATARNHRGIFRSVISGGHVRGLNADVTKINAENVWDRYMGGNGRTLTDSTAKVYKQFYLRAIKLFTDYLADPQGFTPTGRSEARRTRTSHHEFPMADGTTLRVTTAAGADVKVALEAALASLNTEAAQTA